VLKSKEQLPRNSKKRAARTGTAASDVAYTEVTS
jgi:hypothetical protein